MSTKIFQHLRELALALDNCDNEEERNRIEDEIAELQSELEAEDKSHYGGKHEFH